jgi:hypothetical protein
MNECKAMCIPLEQNSKLCRDDDARELNWWDLTTTRPYIAY